MYSHLLYIVARYLSCVSVIAPMLFGMIKAQNNSDAPSVRNKAMEYPRSIGGYFFELGSVSHNASNIDFDRWNFITVQSMKAGGISLHQGFLWNFMPSAENNLIVRLGFNADFAGFREQQSAKIQQLPGWIQKQLPNNAEIDMLQINAQHDISIRLMHLTLSASYRHRILPTVSLEVGAESSALLNANVIVRQSYNIRDGNAFEISGDLDHVTTVGQCPKSVPVPLENVAIPLNIISGLHIHSSEKLSFYARYHHPITPFIPQHSWRTDRLTVGVEFHFDNWNVLNEPLIP